MERSQGLSLGSSDETGVMLALNQGGCMACQIWAEDWTCRVRLRRAERSEGDMVERVRVALV